MILQLSSDLTPHVYSWAGQWTNDSSVTRNFKIVGKGFVFITIGVKSDTVTDTGTVTTYIDLRTSSSYVTTLAGNANRLAAASDNMISASSTGIYHHDGTSVKDRLRCYGRCTKNGTNNWQIQAVTIGCTIEQI